VCPARSRLRTRERDLAVDLAVVGECVDVVRSRDPLRVAQQLGQDRRAIRVARETTSLVLERESELGKGQAQ
jgi:hypothetical protein